MHGTHFRSFMAELRGIDGGRGRVGSGSGRKCTKPDLRSRVKYKYQQRHVLPRRNHTSESRPWLTGVGEMALVDWNRVGREHLALASMCLTQRPCILDFS